MNDDIYARPDLAKKMSRRSEDFLLPANFRPKNHKGFFEPTSRKDSHNGHRPPLRHSSPFGGAAQHQTKDPLFNVSTNISRPGLQRMALGLALGSSHVTLGTLRSCSRDKMRVQQFIRFSIAVFVNLRNKNEDRVSSLVQHRLSKLRAAKWLSVWTITRCKDRMLQWSKKFKMCFEYF